MKYAFMSFSCPKLTLEEMLALARRLGYDGIEPRLAAGHRHGVEVDTDAAGRREIATRVDESGIVLACLATSCSYADPSTAAGMVDETRRCIDLAADIGCARLRVFGGAIPQGISRERAMALVVDSLRALAGQARDRGVTLCLETHDDWTHPDHMAEVMRRVDEPSIAVNWDVMHPVHRSGVTMDRAFRTLWPWTRHVHFHDGLNRPEGPELRPVGQGDVDHQRVVDLLQAAGYDGFLSGEWIGWEPYEVHLPRELATMKRYERDAGG